MRGSQRQDKTNENRKQSHSDTDSGWIQYKNNTGVHITS